MEFITEAWQPVNMTKIRLDGQRETKSQTYELRHWMFILGTVALVLAPVAALTLSGWVVAPLLVCLGLFLLSVATILVPEVELDQYESGNNRRDP